jgi:hypothetical protein
MRTPLPSILAVVFAFLGGFPLWVDAHPSRAPERTAAELANAVLDALVYADAARAKLGESATTKDSIASTMDLMTNQRIAKRRFQEARALLVDGLKPPREAVQLVATAFTEAFQALEKTCDRGIAFHQALLTGKSTDDVAKLATEGSAIAADADEAWRLLPQGVLALSYAMVDDKRLTDGKLQHLRLTSAERASLISRIKRDYPNAEQQRGGHAIDVSASLLLKFLQGGHKSADQK